MNVVFKLFLVVLCTAMIFGCSKMTRENYDKIELGMDYADVVSIIGEPDACDEALGAKQCTWGNESKHIIVKFIGNKVVMPSMKGL